MHNVTLKNETTSVTGYFYQVEQLIFLWVLFTFIVIGNGTVLTALSLSKGRKSRMNFFIKHLAFADLCVGLISVLTDIIWKITITWEAGLVMCKIIRFLQAVVTYSSTYVLVALSIDRYDAITHPMNFTGSWRRAKGLILAAWILSAAFASPILKFFTTTETKDFGTQCWIDFNEKWQWQLYMILVSISLFIIPAIIIGGCYLVIVCTIWSKSKEMQGPTQSNKKGGRKELWNGINDDHESRRASSRGLIPKAKVKTVKMTFVIIFVFILCWSPYFMFDLLQVFEYIPDNETNKAIATFIQSLAPLNSAANPLIYCFFSTNVGHYICNRICRKKGSASTSQDTQTSEKLANTSSLAAANASAEAKKQIRERTVVNARNGVTVWTGPAVQTATIETARR